MKNIKSGGIFIAAYILLILSALVGIWWGVSSIFSALTGDELRSDANATLFVVAVIWLICAILRADDERTSVLSRVMCGIFIAIGALMFVAYATYQSVGEELSKMNEALAWAIPFTWTLPVLIGAIFFVLESLDRYWGQDKKPLVGASQSRVVNMLYGGLYNIGIIAALIASAFGTYEVMYAVTGSFWHAMIYVGTVEVAIYVFASLTHRTQDQEVFWYSFALTIFAFAVAMMFQGVSAVNMLYGALDTDNTAQLFAKNFVLLPPILMGAIAGGLYLFNQRKKHVPFKTSEQTESPRPSQFNSPSRQQSGSSHNKRDFAEPGGLPEELVAHLKRIGYSGNEIRQMTLVQAREYAKKPKTSPEPIVVSENTHKDYVKSEANGAEPKNA